MISISIASITNSTAVTEKVRNFPDLTITINKRKRDDKNLDNKNFISPSLIMQFGHLDFF